MIKVGILGIDGSMGRLITNLAVNDSDIEVVMGFTIPESPNIGMDIGQLIGAPNQNVKINSIKNITEILKKEKVDIFIDFTVVKATEENLPLLVEKQIPVVVGTTGLSKEFLDNISKKAIERKVPLVISSNMAIGVNVVFKIAAELAKRLDGWEIEIIEAHHHRKQDSPSGTALTIAENIADAIDVDFEKVGKYGRDKGSNPRKWGKKEIGIHAIRAGDIVGDHTILYAGNGERIELKHQAHSRNCFASGVITAVKFLMKNRDKIKIFNMNDVLFGEEEN